MGLAESFFKRMKGAGSSVLLVGPNGGSDFLSGIETAEQVATCLRAIQVAF